MKIALVGIGKIALDQHVPALAASPDWDLTATVSRSGQVPGVLAFHDIDTMLAAHPEICAISLCLPPVPRFAAAVAVLRAGRHLMLEKPPGATLSEVHVLCDMAAAQGLTPVGAVAQAGLLRPGLVAAHALHVTPGDIALMADAGVGVAHNARANGKGGRGIAPVVAMRAAGIPVGIATDGPMSGNTLDLFAQFAPVSMFQKLAAGSRGPIPDSSSQSPARRACG